LTTSKASIGFVPEENLGFAGFPAKADLAFLTQGGEIQQPEPQILDLGSRRKDFPDEAVQARELMCQFTELPVTAIPCRLLHCGPKPGLATLHNTSDGLDLLHQGPDDA